MFFVFGGLPGTGKTTIARALARRTGATWLRLDSIEQAIRTSGIADVGPAGYLAVYALAADNLRLGRMVIADTVNPLAVTRNAFRAVANETGAGLVEIEVVCSDPALHRHRAESRPMDIEGHTWPDWEGITNRKYDMWDRPVLRLDSARLSVEQSVETILAAICVP